MTAAQGIARLRRHIARHTPFLTAAEQKLFEPTPAELRLLERSQEIARRMGARLPGARA